MYNYSLISIRFSNGLLFAAFVFVGSLCGSVWIAWADEPGLSKTKLNGEKTCILRGYVRDSDGQPIANARVNVVTPTRDMRFSAEDAPSGALDVIKQFMMTKREYVVTANESGAYMVKVPNLSGPIMASIDVAAPGFQRLSGTLMRGGDDRTTRLVPKGIARENFTLKPAAYFRGSVVDQDGNPVDEASVGANLTFGGAVGGVERTETNAKGEFEIFNFSEEIAEGEVGSVYVQHPGFLLHRLSPVHGIDAADRDQIRIVLDSGQSISGTVVDAAGHPASACMVKAVGAGGRGRKAVLTDDLGRFALKGLPRGKLTLKSRDLANNEKAVQVLEGESAHENIQLKMKKMDLPAAIPLHKVLGMSLTDMTPELQEAYDLLRGDGAVIMKPGLDWVRLGIGKLERGFTFWMVGQQKVSGVRDFVETIIAEAETQDGPDFSVRVVYSMSVVQFDGSNTQYLALTEQDIRDLKKILASMPDNG